MPSFIIDAETFEELKVEQLEHEVIVKPQMSQSVLDSLKQFAETAKKIGTGLSIWQVILFFSLGKALKSMWPLLLTVQFVVYVSQW